MFESCPSQNQLSSLFNGTLSSDDRDWLEQHVTECDRCRSTVARLSQSLRESFSARLTDHAAASDVRADQLDALIEEFLSCLRSGIAISVEHFAARHPSVGKELLELLPTIMAMEENAIESEPKVHFDFPSLPGYEILGVIGEGGMGIVYRARDLNLGRIVAIKMINATHGSSQLIAERFQIEAESLGRLKHPNIVHLYHSGVVDDRPFYVLEFVNGPDLAQLIRKRSIPVVIVARILEPLANAVAAAHQQNVLHRDLKPHNVLLQRLNSDETSTTESAEQILSELEDENRDLLSVIPKLSDFGLAKRLEAHGPTASGDVIGTPGYMAPEQAQDSPEGVTAAADVYGLGAVMYELLTGRPPFLAGTRLATLYQVANKEPVAPRVLRPEIPKSLEAICLKCLAKLPADRYASAHELAEDLQRFLRHQQTEARAPTVFERSINWCRKNSLAAAVMGLVLMLGVTMSGVLAHSIHQRSVEVLETRFRSAARERFLVIRNHITSEQEVVRLLASFMEAQDSVEPQEFLTFCDRTLKRHPSIAALEWVPRVFEVDRKEHERNGQAQIDPMYEIRWRMHDGALVRAGGRDEYFPVYFVEPSEGNEAALGFDIASESARAEALSVAAENDEVSVTGAIRLVQDDSGAVAILACVPAYSVSSEDNERSRDSLKGYCVGVFRIADLIQDALSVFDQNVEVTVFDESQDRQILFNTLGATDPSVSQAETEEFMDNGGRKWAFRFSLRPTGEQRSTHIPWFVFGGGCAITVLLCLAVARIARRV